MTTGGTWILGKQSSKFEERNLDILHMEQVMMKNIQPKDRTNDEDDEVVIDLLRVNCSYTFLLQVDSSMVT